MKRVLMLVLSLVFLATAAFAGININTATVSELETLSGIGPAKAEAIVKYREANGKFKTKKDLTQVKGIGKKLVNKISGEIEVAK